MSAHTLNLVAFAALTLAFQAFSLKAFASSISVSGLGMLAVGFAFGPWQAVVVAALAACVHAAMRRPAWYKVAFNVACFSLSAGTAAAFYRGLAGAGHSTLEHAVVALGASCIFLGLNAGLLAAVMALERAPEPHPDLAVPPRLDLAGLPHLRPARLPRRAGVRARCRGRPARARDERRACGRRPPLYLRSCHEPARLARARGRQRLAPRPYTRAMDDIAHDEPQFDQLVSDASTRCPTTSPR